MENEIDTPPRPMRADYPSSEEYRRATSRWRALKRMRRLRIFEPDRVRAANKKHRDSHKAEIAAHNKEWRERTGYDTSPARMAYLEANRDRRAAHQRQYVAVNKEKVATRSKAWREANKEHIARKNKEYRAANSERLNEYNRAYYAENKPRFLQYNRLNEANREAAPPWLTREQWKEMDEVYKAAEKMTAITGIQHCVDHIWPLIGKNSCGLHVPWNLRVISHAENSKKRNGNPHEES
jgi:hypothetical protein